MQNYLDGFDGLRLIAWYGWAEATARSRRRAGFGFVNGAWTLPGIDESIRLVEGQELDDATIDSFIARHAAAAAAAWRSSGVAWPVIDQMDRGFGGLA